MNKKYNEKSAKKIFICVPEERLCNEFKNVLNLNGFNDVTTKHNIDVSKEFDTYIFFIKGEILDESISLFIKNVACYKKIFVVSDSNSIEFGYKLAKLGVDNLTHVECISERTISEISSKLIIFLKESEK